MARNFIPFKEGVTRPKQVLSFGLYRTGSQSLAEALSILGYRDVYHSASISDNFDRVKGLGIAADDNIPCLPSYTGKTWTRKDWDAYFGPCEALTDVTPFAEVMLEAYPEAKVILVRRDFDSWANSFVETLAKPSSNGILAWLSAYCMEAMVGLHITRTAQKMFLGLAGVSDMSKTKNVRILRAAYDRHHKNIKRLVPADRLLELKLEELHWEPLCEFLGKNVPTKPFPRLNESAVIKGQYKKLHRYAVLGGMLKLLPYVGGCLLVVFCAVWLAPAGLPGS